MNSARRLLIAMAVAIILLPTPLSGCSNLQGSELPSRPRSCSEHEQMICRGGTATRLEHRTNRGRICSCGRLEDFTR